MDIAHIPIVLLALFALLVVVYVAWSLLGPIIQMTYGSSERRAIKARQNQLLKLDEAINKEQYPQALQLVENALFLDVITLSENLIKIVSGHNLSLLGKLLVIADAKSIQLQNVAVLEELLNTRSSLLFGLYEAKQSLLAAKAERRSKGQSLPRWAKEEYQRKIDDFQEKLLTNKKSLVSELRNSCEILSGRGAKEDVTYH